MVACYVKKGILPALNIYIEAKPHGQAKKS